MKNEPRLGTATLPNVSMSHEMGTPEPRVPHTPLFLSMPIWQQLKRNCTKCSTTTLESVSQPLEGHDCPDSWAPHLKGFHQTRPPPIPKFAEPFRIPENLSHSPAARGPVDNIWRMQVEGIRGRADRCRCGSSTRVGVRHAGGALSCRESESRINRKWAQRWRWRWRC